jgi:hypothetical protein
LFFSVRCSPASAQVFFAGALGVGRHVESFRVAVAALSIKEVYLMGS